MRHVKPPFHNEEEGHELPRAGSTPQPPLARGPTGPGSSLMARGWSISTQHPTLAGLHKAHTQPTVGASQVAGGPCYYLPWGSLSWSPGLLSILPPVT